MVIPILDFIEESVALVDGALVFHAFMDCLFMFLKMAVLGVGI